MQVLRYGVILWRRFVAGQTGDGFTAEGAEGTEGRVMNGPPEAA